jgi:hypothetical protein
MVCTTDETTGRACDSEPLVAIPSGALLPDIGRPGGAGEEATEDRPRHAGWERRCCRGAVGWPSGGRGRGRGGQERWWLGCGGER